MDRKLGRLTGLGVAIIAGFSASPARAQSLSLILFESDTVYCDASQALYCDVAVSCPSGLVVWGGGAEAEDAKIQASYPVDESIWKVTFSPNRYDLGSSVIAVAQAEVNCGPRPAGYELVRGTNTPCSVDGASCTADLACPAGKTAITGAFEGFESDVESIRPMDDQTWRIAWYPDDEDVGSDASGWAWPHVICVDEAPQGFIVRGPQQQSCSAGDACFDLADCNAGEAALSVGSIGVQSKVGALALRRSGTGVGWWSARYEFGPGTVGLMTPLASCAAGRNVLDDLLFSSFD
jgi:hypothetical protein